jgi:hypothetical protein
VIFFQKRSALRNIRLVECSIAELMRRIAIAAWVVDSGMRRRFEREGCRKPNSTSTRQTTRNACSARLPLRKNALQCITLAACNGADDQERLPARGDSFG